MNYQEFLMNVEHAISTQLPENYTTYVQAFQKNNGVKYDGLVVMDPKVNMSPTIYLTPYYHRFLNGVSIDDICKDILSVYNNRMPAISFDVSNFTDYDKVKDTIIAKLINYEANKDFLQQVPFIKFHDLAIIFQSLAFCNKDMGTITITRNHAKILDVDAQTLYSLALKNMPRLLPPKLLNLNDYVKKMNPERIDSLEEFGEYIQMFVLSNTKDTNGASTMIYPNLLHDIAADQGKDLIIIPSSIHELLLIPVDSLDNVNFYNQMVEEVNNMELSKEEVLSGHIYYYSLLEEEVIIP